MKKVIMALCLIWSLAFVSCENWLDVKPKAEIKWDVFFETEQGFKDALLGCYCTLSERSLYGGEMTCLFLDALAQQYYYTNTSSYNSVFMYQYNSSQVTGFIDNIWSKMYNVLANVNSIIEAVEEHGDVMTPTVRSLVKAEAYSLRAYLYWFVCLLGVIWQTVQTARKSSPEWPFHTLKCMTNTLFPKRP